MRSVVALGGNALLARGQSPDAEPQRLRVRAAARALADATRGHELLIVHGNGPQVGMLALESTADQALHRPYPLADLTAETQGLIGHWIAAGLRAASPSRSAAALITHVVVDPTDASLATPTKPIGPVVSKEIAADASRTLHWQFHPEGNGMRRVVGSPKPGPVIEVPQAETLLRSGTVVIIGGGGGIPITDEGDEIDAVIDKDLVAARIAIDLHADRLVILTDVSAVVDGWGTPEARPLHGPIGSDQMRQLVFTPGSMGPKVAAACEFSEATGGIAAIGALTDAAAVISGGAGTQIHPSSTNAVI